MLLLNAASLVDASQWVKGELNDEKVCQSLQLCHGRETCSSIFAVPENASRMVSVRQNNRNQGNLSILEPTALTRM